MATRNITAEIVTCPACFNSGADITVLDHHEPCILCWGVGMVTQPVKRDWYAVRTLVRFPDLPIPSTLMQWREYIESERSQ